jgi:hypothetical protein
MSRRWSWPTSSPRSPKSPPQLGVVSNVAVTSWPTRSCAAGACPSGDQDHLLGGRSPLWQADQKASWRLRLPMQRLSCETERVLRRTPVAQSRGWLATSRLNTTTYCVVGCDRLSRCIGRRLSRCIGRKACSRCIARKTPQRAGYSWCCSAFSSWVWRRARVALWAGRRRCISSGRSLTLTATPTAPPSP